MSAVLSKEVTVLSIQPVTEISTGDTLSQVTFGEKVKATAETIARVGRPVTENFVSGFWIGFNFKGDIVPYQVGSKWKFSVLADGTVSLVKA